MRNPRIIKKATKLYIPLSELKFSNSGFLISYCTLNSKFDIKILERITYLSSSCLFRVPKAFAHSFLVPDSQKSF